MSWYNKILGFFVKDSAERKRFIDEFNRSAQTGFQNLSVNALFSASVCEGNIDPSYRHQLSAPRFASGIVIKIIAGVNIPVDDIIWIAQIILLDRPITRRMFVLHWDTLIIKDERTGKQISWRIKDFIDFGGLLNNNG